MKRLLLISYVFPPAAGGGVQRPLKFAKYLGRFGWQPIVLTARRPSAPAWDPELLKELGPEVEVRRLLNLEPGAGGRGNGAGAEGGGRKRRLAHLLLPDRHLLWLPTALPQALAATRGRRAALVMVSAPPFSSFLLGWALSRLKGLPLVLDFRDEWSGFYAQGFDPRQAGGWRLRLIRRLERRLVRAATTVLTASLGASQRLHALYGGPTDKYVWIPNGYDPEDFTGPSPPPEDGRLSLVYVGTLFGVTSLRHLWAALALLEPAQRARLRVKVVGRVTEGEVSDPGLPGLQVEVTGYQDHLRAVAEMRRAGALVLTLEDLPGSPRVIPAKLFEYLAARRPILCLTPAGEASAIVEASGAGAVVLPGRPQELARLLQSWLQAPPPVPQAPPERFSRPELTRRLAQVLDRVAAGPGQS
ncbi:MAG: glycosyltransferase [Thermodesulfobacteriota bacterium]